uniref:Uncharacterized protein n=1 Tax=Globodera rostochiensis TaxID=31243 RepID=A0A914I2I0_GLORO
MANIYDEFIIVEEKRVMDFTFQNRCTAGCKDVYLCPHINSKFVDLTAFASLEFKNHWFSLYIKDIASHSTKVPSDMDKSGSNKPKELAVQTLDGCEMRL